MTTTSAVLGLPYIASSQSQPDVTHNQAVAMLQIMIAGGAISVGLNTPPGSPTEGDVYVIGTSPTGVWAGKPNVVAGYFLSQWLYLPGNDSSGTQIDMGADQVGLHLYSKADNSEYTWSDSGESPSVYSWQPSGDIITVFGRTGVVVPVADDYDASEVTNALDKTGANTQFWSGAGSGFPYGSMYVADGDTFTVPIAGTTPVEVNNGTPTFAGFTATELNQITFSDGGSPEVNPHYLKVTRAGVYACWWSMTISKSGGGATNAHGGIMVDGVALRGNGEGHRTISTSSDLGNYGMPVIIPCPNGTEQLSLWISDTSSINLDVEHAALVVMQVGGL